MMVQNAVFTLLCGLALALAAAPARAFEPRFAQPVLGITDYPALFDSYDLPLAAWRDGVLPVQPLEGQVNRRAWQLALQGGSLLDLIGPLRDQLKAEGWEIQLECVAKACGGFDFRFNIPVLPEPGMHVDLNYFRFVSARRGDEGISLLTSRSGDNLFLQMIRVGAEALPPLREQDQPGDPALAQTSAPSPAEPGTTKAEGLPAGNLPPESLLPKSLLPGSPPGEEVTAAPARGSEPGPGGKEALDQGLPMVLEDLRFETGSATLSRGSYSSLRLLADWLQANPEARLILAGHTDLSGDLEANITLSKRRAEAVRQALIRDYPIKAGRVLAAGAGPLSPRESNETEAGRERNRRVEAISAP